MTYTVKMINDGEWGVYANPVLVVATFDNPFEAIRKAAQLRGEDERMKFNWLSLVQLIPAVVMGIQQIHSTAAGATKKQLALESLGLATAAADAVLPADQAAMADSVSGLIDNFVSLFHSTNAPGFGTNSVPAAAAAVAKTA